MPFEAVYVPFFAIGKEAYLYAPPPVLAHHPPTRFSPALQDAIFASELLFTRRIVQLIGDAVHTALPAVVV